MAIVAVATLAPFREAVKSTRGALQRVGRHLLQRCAARTRHLCGKMFVDTPDGPIHVELSGSGSRTPVLFVHGLGGSGASWAGLVAALGAERPVGAVDLRGCGSSAHGSGTITLERLADDCAAVINSAWGRRCHLVGHSLGGVIVQDLLVRYPTLCAAAVLVSTSSKVGEKAAESWRRLADIVERRGLSESGGQRSFSEGFAARNPGVVTEHARIAAAADPIVYAAQARAASSYDYGAKLAAVTNPVLIIQGLDDRLTSTGGSVILNRALSNSELMMLADVGHNAHVELGARFAEIVRDFLSRHEAAALA